MKQVIAILKLLLLAALFPPAARGQGNGAAKKITDQLSRFEANYPAEKAYLQFDKPYYAAGDTIYFKAYVTLGEQHELSSLSGVLHVDLINAKNRIDQSIKLKLDSGLAWGDFALPDSLPAGNYRVRAYTQWMRNFGETGFFDKLIPIGSIKAEKIPESLVKQPAADSKPDVQFFPEGGSLIAGIRSKVAFKAIGANGAGISITGTVIDNDNHEVARFESAHLGMGSFYFTPDAGKSYKAKIVYPHGKEDAADLPQALNAGITLTVNNDSIPAAAVRIEASAGYYAQNHGRIFTLVIYSPGSAATVSCKLDSTVITLQVLKRKLHTGVATITLFSPDNEPLCERLLFIQNYDQLSLALNTGKMTYAKREKVNIRVNALNRKGEPATGHFSVSVIDESKVQEADQNDTGNILTGLLLTSDLKGYVEQPAYYFSDTSMAARKNLDILMLTQGYRRFEWKRALDSSVKKLAYHPEKGLSVEGYVKNVFNKTVASGTVNLWQPIGGLLLSTKTDDKGKFSFPGLVFSDTAHMVLSAIKANGKNSTQITWLKDAADSPPIFPITESTQEISSTALVNYAVNAKAQHTEVTNFLKGKVLKEVNIKARKRDDQYHTFSLAGAGNADQVIHPKDVLYGGPLSVRLSGLITGVHFLTRSGTPYMVPFLNGSRIPMSVIVDGVPGSLDEVSTDGFETVEILKPPTSYVYGSGGLDGVIIVTTKPRGSDPEGVAAIGVLPIAPLGFYKAREFYSPKYENPPAAVTQPDLRSTIYWNPEIKTDKDGNAAFEFYNADGAGNYKVTIEGIDKDGSLGRQVYRFTVE